MNDRQPGLLELIVKTSVSHTMSYFLMGLIASTSLNYAARFARPEMICWMRQLDDPLVMAGPLFQPIRGVIFALAFYPLREIVFKKRGWLVMGWLLTALGILSTFGPAPGSVEGMIYTVLPILGQITGWLEVVPQAFLLSALLFYWVKHPEKRWLNWVLGIGFVLILLLPILGLLIG
ncbi:MAG: hypothetical protein JXA33_15365 [Anaerolineae bacterium]|nr:hypothetical protein [Anaerolineae bacterium]